MPSSLVVREGSSDPEYAFSEKSVWPVVEGVASMPRFGCDSWARIPQLDGNQLGRTS